MEIKENHQDILTPVSITFSYSTMAERYLKQGCPLKFPLALIQSKSFDIGYLPIRYFIKYVSDTLK